MDDSWIKDKLAPCGLHCAKCFAFSGGEIKKHSKGLADALGSFDVYASRFADLLDEPVFKKYPEFKDLLSYFNKVNCLGCRKEKCRLFTDCRVRDCSAEKRVDYCFQCNEFPCDHTGYDHHLYKRFVEINMKMKNLGVEGYYNEIRDRPRY